jgi:hypothetical protein
LNLHEKQKNESSKFKRHIHTVHSEYVLYFNTNKCNSIKFSKRKNTFVYKIS